MRDSNDRVYIFDSVFNRKERECATLEGKVAIVTGASSGIGAATALALANAGVKVTLAARREDKLNGIEKSITENGGVAISVKTDVTMKNEVVEMVRKTEMTFGPVDILVNSAGILYFALIKNGHFDQWDRQIDVNCKGVTNCIGAVLDGMIQRKSGHIVNISSDAGRRGFPGLAVYSGTKHFVEGFSNGLRREIVGSGVKVTCIQPGNAKTEMFDNTTDEEAKSQYDDSSDHTILDPEDVARAIIYAVSQPKHVVVNEVLIQPPTEFI